MKPQSQGRKKMQSDDGQRKQQLYQAMVALQAVSEAKDFLMDLCTPNEIQAMADRWWVVDLIKQGMPYRQISEITGVSVTTIGRVARHLMMGAGGYEMIYKRLKEML